MWTPRMGDPARRGQTADYFRRHHRLCACRRERKISVASQISPAGRGGRPSARDRRSAVFKHGLQYKDHAHIPFYSHGISVVVNAGETTQVTLGGSGRTVIGKAVVPNASASVPWTENASTLTLKVPGDLRLPMRQSFDSEAAFGAAIK